MEWKDWNTFPDVDSTVVKALRTLVFNEVMRKKQIIRPIDAREYPRRVKDGLTLIGARIIWFFVQNSNEWTPLGRVRHYLINKYGYAPTTVDGSGMMVIRTLCEEDEELIRLKPDLYYQAIEVIENEETAEELSERFPILDLEFYARWLDEHENHRTVPSTHNHDSEEDEDSEPSVELVLRNGSRVRIVLEVVVKNVRFEVV
ncbi:hypothetical protein [Palaeococcus ferrophilus]|uniref:hypothetical protein n=1 Tax=Palaeococcus ferrophilus TaxID=83868 RepID=UPI00064FEADB|nr:hypothetical protein [Palaeococcus ferrophilus]